ARRRARPWNRCSNGARNEIFRRPNESRKVVDARPVTPLGRPIRRRYMPSATTVDLAALLTEVKVALPLPIVTVVSDGQETIRQAVESALPDLPHRVWRYDADRAGLWGVGWWALGGGPLGGILPEYSARVGEYSSDATKSIFWRCACRAGILP